MRVRKQILSVCLAFLLAVAGIVPAFSVTPYAGTTQYTWEIPLKLTVKEGGSAAAPAHDFEIELHHLDGSKIDLAAFEGEFVQNSPYVETSGIGEYTTTLRFRGGEELRLQLSDGFIVILKDSDEDGWVYDEQEYEVNAWFDGAGIMTEFSIIDCDSGDSKDAAAFECTYTGWYLHFETNGGSAIGAVSAADGSTIYLSGYTPTRNNYTFNGWYEDTALQTLAEKVTLDQETWVYAGWLESEPTTVNYTLTFDTDGGSAIGSVTRAEGTVLDLSAYTPTKTGYTFTGWYSDSTLQTKVTSVTLDQDKTVYAGWTKNTVYYNLYFNTLGGSAISTLRRVEGTVINLSAYTPTRDGYTFTGWYAERSLKNKISSVTLDSSKTVYAGWEEITYTWEIPAELSVEQGGSLSVPEKTFTLEAVVDGETIGGAGCSYDITLDSDSIAAAGAGTYEATLTFSGDYTAALAISEGFSLSLSDDSDEGWSIDDTEYTVTVEFDWETGEMTGFELTAAGKAKGSLNAAAFTCTYTGWTLDFETNGGSAIDSVPTVDGTEIDLSDYTPIRAGFTFTGWYSDRTLETEVTSVTLDEDKTVYAGWEKIIYTWTVPVEITAEQSGSVNVPGRDINLEVIVDGEMIDGVGTDYGITMDPGFVTVTGEGTFEEMVTFTGDYEAAQLVTGGFSVGLADDGEAGWSIDDTEYTVTVDFDWETGEMTELSIQRSGFYLFRIGSGNVASFSCSYTGWTLNFETNGGSAIDSVSAAEGTIVDLTLADYTPTRDGYTFTGWYSDSALETEVDSITLDADQTVYAGWAAITYTWEIPVELTVKQGGSLSVPEKVFTLETLADGEIIGGEGSEYEMVMNSAAITVTGAGTCEVTLTFTGNYDAAVKVSEGFYLSLAEDSEAGWVCEDTVYIICAEFDWETGEMTGAYIEVFEEETTERVGDVRASGEGNTEGVGNVRASGEAQETGLSAATFTCTYTGWTLEFDTTGGTSVESVTAVDGTVVDLSGYVPTRTGYTFTGWYEESTCETRIAEVTLDADMTVYAGWEEQSDSDVGSSSQTTGTGSTQTTGSGSTQTGDTAAADVWVVLFLLGGLSAAVVVLADRRRCRGRG